MSEKSNPPRFVNLQPFSVSVSSGPPDHQQWQIIPYANRHRAQPNERWFVEGEYFAQFVYPKLLAPEPPPEPFRTETTTPSAAEPVTPVVEPIVEPTVASTTVETVGETDSESENPAGDSDSVTDDDGEDDGDTDDDDLPTERTAADQAIIDKLAVFFHKEVKNAAYTPQSDAEAMQVFNFIQSKGKKHLPKRLKQLKPQLKAYFGF